MPWTASSVMEERLRFGPRLLDGESMTEVCREFGIWRKTGYKIFDRYKEHGLAALTDRSRRPVRYANQLPVQVETLIVRLKGEKPHWGARKIRELLVRRLSGDVRVPARQHHPRRARSPRPGQARRRAPPSRARHAPVSGRRPQRPVVRRLQGRVQARQRPLLLSAHRHRPCLAFPALVRGAGIKPRGHSLHRLRAAVCPNAACRSPSAPTTASPSPVPMLCSTSPSSRSGGSASASPMNASSQAVPSRTAAAERMHLTLKKEATRPPGGNSLQQQARFDAFMHEFNTERPHEALAMKCPAELYAVSPRRYNGLPEFDYPFHDRNILVTTCGRICLHRKKIEYFQSMTASGSSASPTTISDTSIWSRGPPIPRQPVRPEVVTQYRKSCVFPQDFVAEYELPFSGSATA